MRRNNVVSVLLLLALLLFSSSAAFSEDVFNFAPGVYPDDIFLKLSEIPNGIRVKYSFKANDPSPNLPYGGGVLLSAINGEERKYSISISINGENRYYEYIIDKKKPAQPVRKLTTTEQGTGYVFDYDGKSRIRYGYDDYRNDEIFTWNGELIRPPTNGFIYYYAEDQAGNRSVPGMIVPQEEISRSGRINLEVKSPVEGKFLNTQLLYIEREGFEWIRYTLNGYDPVDSGADYTEPVEIRRYGNVQLRVAAKPLYSDRIITREINYSVNTKAPIKNIPPSGIYSSAINIQGLFGSYNYCLEERSPAATDNLFTGELKINPVYGGVKNSVLRLADLSENDEGDFRFFYIIDDRYPANPLISFKSRLPEQNILEVRMSGPVYSEIYFTADGSSPGKSSSIYREPFTIDIPDNKNAGSIILKARAISLNGKPSSVVSKIFTYDTEKPDVPGVSFIKDPKTGIYSIDYSIGGDETLYYCLAGKNTEYSFSDFEKVDRENFFIDVPDGYKKTFDFIFTSLDSAGNRSDFTKPVEVTIDKTVPAPPVISFENGTAAVEYNREGFELSYTLSIMKNGKTVFTENGEYTEPITVDTEKYKNTTLSLSATVSDDYGNTRTSKSSFYINSVSDPKETVLFSRKTEDIYSGDEVSFLAYPDGIDDKLFYYLTTVSADGDNTEGPFETDGKITVKGTPGTTRDYRLEVFSVNEDSGTRSKVSSYEFTIDNEKPGMPAFYGIENGSLVSDRVILTADSDGKSVVFINVGNTPDVGELFSNSSIIFNKPIKFDAAKGKDKIFYLKIGAGDAAGNSVVNDELFSFRIDKKPPEILSASVDTEPDGAGSRPVLKLTANEDCIYYYEHGRIGSRIKTPGINSSSFTGSLPLESPDSPDGTYIIRVAAADKAGNISEYPVSFMYKIDRSLPSNNLKPKFTLNEKNRKVFSSFPQSVDDIFYRVNGAETETPYIKYEHPFSIKYSGDSEQLSLSYYLTDESGNKSEIKTALYDLPVAVSRELVEGIKNNSFYSEDLELKAVKSSKIIRYEISTDQLLPRDVSVFSPVLPDVLPFRIAEGESINFIVSLKEFENNDDVKGGAEQVLRFTIDKQLPEPPEIEGIKDGEYYLDDCTAFFKPTADRIFYSVTADVELSDNYKEFSGPFEINTPKGTFYSYDIKAYTQDFAGNRSAVKDWSITIDKEIIYVSRDGRDYYEGTRSKPFQSLNKALEQVKISDRKTIFIQEGSYRLNSPGVVDEAVSIYGGFKKGSWQDKSGDTEILIDTVFPDSNPAFYIYGGNLTLENLDFSIKDKNINTVFYINKGDLSLRNGIVLIENINDSFIKQDYGRLTVNNTQFSGKIKGSPLLENKYGNIEINNSRFNFSTDSTIGVLLDAENCVNYVINNSEFRIGSGKNFTLMNLKNSAVKLKSDRIQMNKCSVSSTIIEAVDSKISMDYCRMDTLNTNRISRAMITEDSGLSLNGNTFSLDALSGVIGFNITGGDSFFSNNKYTVLECNDFSYLYLIDGGSHQIETNLVNIHSSDEILGMRLKNGDVDFLNNTVLIKSANSKSAVFKTDRNSLARIINNIIDNTGVAEGTLVYSEFENMISLKNNCVFGWKHLIDGKNAADDIISLDLVDGIYSEGRFSGNIEEDPGLTFVDEGSYRLSGQSKCIDSGYNLNNIIRDRKDIDGDQRPNRSLNRASAYDIGADEYYN